MMRLFKYCTLFVIATLLLQGTACKKNTKSCNGVPVVAVNFTIDLNQPAYNPLVVNGGYMTVSGGYANNGIIVYHYTTNQFNSFDCTCPYDGNTNSKAILAVDKSGLYAVCPVCGSSFLLSDGSVSKGPATCPMKRYTTTYDGSSTVTVSN